MKDGFDLIIERTNRRLGWVKRDIDRMCEKARARLDSRIDVEIARVTPYFGRARIDDAQLGNFDWSAFTASIVCAPFLLEA